MVPQEGALRLEQVPHRLPPLGLQAGLHLRRVREGEARRGQWGDSHGRAAGAARNYAAKINGSSQAEQKLVVKEV